MNAPRAVKQIIKPQYVTEGAGKYEGAIGPVTEIAARPRYMDVVLEPNAEFFLPVPEGHSAVAYLFQGTALFGLNGIGELIEAVNMVVFDDGDHIRVKTTADSQARFMLMAGKPFKEPVVPYGPFVMNTCKEIQQALSDLRNGTFVQN